MLVAETGVPFVMAFEAKSWHPHPQKAGTLAAMGEVAFQTRILARGVDGNSNGYVDHVLVAEGA